MVGKYKYLIIIIQHKFNNVNVWWKRKEGEESRTNKFTIQIQIQGQIQIQQCGCIIEIKNTKATQI